MAVLFDDSITVKHYQWKHSLILCNLFFLDDLRINKNTWISNNWLLQCMIRVWRVSYFGPNPNNNDII